jgi:hypothetical protein
MKALRLTLTTLLVSTLVSWADFSDNFDGYANKAAFDASWTVSVGLGLDLNTSEFASSPNSVKNAATASTPAAQSRKLIAPDASGWAPTDNFTFSFNFYDSVVSTGLRDYGMLYSRVGTDWAGGLNQLVAIGKYNAGGADRYYARVAIGSGSHVLGDGAVSVGTGWFYLDNAPAQSVGWHSASIVGTEDPNDPTKGLLRFYIDGQLGGSVGNVDFALLNWAVLGSGLSSPGVGWLAFDDVLVLIPEPSTLLLGLLGGLGMLWIGRRRAV